MRTLYVGGLPPETDGPRLEALFSRYGKLSSARIVRRRAHGTERGFGYVTFCSASAASKARRALDGLELSGNRLRVAPAS